MEFSFAFSGLLMLLLDKKVSLTPLSSYKWASNLMTEWYIWLLCIKLTQEEMAVMDEMDVTEQVELRLVIFNLMLLQVFSPEVDGPSRNFHFIVCSILYTHILYI